MVLAASVTIIVKIIVGHYGRHGIAIDSEKLVAMKNNVGNYTSLKITKFTGKDAGDHK